MRYEPQTEKVPDMDKIATNQVLVVVAWFLLPLIPRPNFFTIKVGAATSMAFCTE